jgi:hypothetical protein
LSIYIIKRDKKLPLLTHFHFTGKYYGLLLVNKARVRLADLVLHKFPYYTLNARDKRLRMKKMKKEKDKCLRIRPPLLKFLANVMSSVPKIVKSSK